MSKYTLELREICTDYIGEEADNMSVNEIIASAKPMVFNFEYPIFDEGYRNVLETKIIKHYYMREIGGETVAMWRMWLDRKMNEIMPYYNKLYQSELLSFNPLYDVDITTEHTRTVEGSKNDTGEATTTVATEDENSENLLAKNVYSDTPQGSLTNVENMEYLTNASIDDNVRNNSRTTNTVNSGSSEANSVMNNTEDYLQRVSGKQAGRSYAKMLTEYRATFLNIDLMVIEELNNLFMGVW